MYSFFNDLEEFFTGDETGEDRINYQLLLATQDCLNIMVSQLHKLEPVAHDDGSGNPLGESFEDRIQFLDYGASMETFIYQTKKFQSLITTFAKRIKSRELLEFVSDQDSTIYDKVDQYISNNETLAKRIASGQPYVSPVDFIVEGKVNVADDDYICVYAEEMSPMYHSWQIALQEYRKYING